MRITGVKLLRLRGTMAFEGPFWEERLVRPVDLYPEHASQGEQPIAQVEPEMLRRYPSPSAQVFREAAAAVLGVTPDMILAGNGSDDVLTIATRTFVPHGGTLVSPDPSYSLYPVLARIEDAKFVGVPWGKEWSLPVNELAAAKGDAIYLANPNAHSGTFVTNSSCRNVLYARQIAIAHWRSLRKDRNRPSVG